MKRIISIKELKQYFGELDCKQFGVFSLKRIYCGLPHSPSCRKITIKDDDLEKVLETTKNFQTLLRELSDILEKHRVSKDIRLNLDYDIEFGYYKYKIGSAHLEYGCDATRHNCFEIETDIDERTFRFGGPAQ